MELALRFFCDLYFDRELFLKGAGSHVAIQNQVALVNSFIVKNVDFGFFGVKYDLCILLKTYLLWVVFIEVEFIAFNFLGWWLMEVLRLFLVVKDLPVAVGLQVF